MTQDHHHFIPKARSAAPELITLISTRGLPHVCQQLVLVPFARECDLASEGGRRVTLLSEGETEPQRVEWPEPAES